MSHDQIYGDEYKQNLTDVIKSVDKSSIIFILEARIKEIHSELEELNLTDKQTNALRGGIFEIRSFLDLINTSA